jgi:uncharacterized protein (TIGR03000 family)
MMKTNCLRVLTVLATVLALSVASQAHAGWGWHGGSWGSYGGGSYGGGSWGSYGGGSWGSYGGGSWGSYGGGSWGSYGGSVGWRPGAVLHRMHARHYASYGSYGDSWGSYGGGWGGYSYRTYSAPVTYRYADPVVVEAAPVVESYYPSASVVVDDCCGVATESYGGVIVDESYGGEVIEGESYPVESYETPATEVPTDEVPSGDEGAAADEDKSAFITVDVPQEAIVYVNGYRTQSTGSHRQFMSAGMKPGQTYAFQVRAVVDRGGKALGQTKVVSLAGGQRSHVVFDNLESEQSHLTTVKLHVPEDAVVTLAGQVTEMQGSTRVFATSRLAAGQTWDNYNVRVSVVRDGREIVRQRDITVRAGDVHELSLLVDETTLASN